IPRVYQFRHQGPGVRDRILAWLCGLPGRLRSEPSGGLDGTMMRFSLSDRMTDRMPPIPPITQALILANVLLFFVDELMGRTLSMWMALWPLESPYFLPWQVL